MKRQELGNELQSSQHLRLQSASRKLLDIATVPAPSGKVQFKKCIDGIPRTEIERHCRASLDRTAEGSRPHVVFAERKKAALGRLFVSRIQAAYDETAPACGVAAAAVAAAASFRIRWWMVNSANSRRSETPILSYTLRR
jgi:hypothetical protein